MWWWVWVGEWWEGAAATATATIATCQLLVWELLLVVVGGVVG